MTSMPTVSAALGCSPTARVRRPQRDRKSMIWMKITMTITRHRDRAPGRGTSRRSSRRRAGRRASPAGRSLSNRPPPPRSWPDQAVQVAGEADGGDVDDRAADDLVGADADREPGVHDRPAATPDRTAATTRDDQRQRDAEDDRRRRSAAAPAPRPSPTAKPTNAPVSIMPSMPMFTTPLRSHRIPHIAPSAIGRRARQDARRDARDASRCR